MRQESMCDWFHWGSRNARVGRLPDDGGMELRGQEGDSLAIVREANNIYLIELKFMTLALLTWMVNGGRTELTHQEFVERLKRVSMAAKGVQGGVDDLVSPTRSPIIHDGDGISTESTSGKVITDLSVKIPGFDSYTTCITEKSIYKDVDVDVDGRVTRTGLYRHSRSHVCCARQRERICVCHHG